MTAKTLRIREIARFDHEGVEETLEFKDGLNVLVGLPNTGKTQWLRMLDFILGDSDKPGDSFDEDLATKYHTLQARVSLGETELTIERSWERPDSTSRVVLSGTPMTADAFNDELLRLLGIPELRYPQGNPLGPRTWPTLGWRSLLRQIYRRQSSWNDIAHRQPDSEQHAVLLQFLGLAEKVFSANANKLADRQKELLRLQAAKDQFYDALNLVSKKLTAGDLTAVTPDSLNDAEGDLKRKSDELQQKRERLLVSVRQAASLPESEDLIAHLTQRAASLAEEQSALDKEVARAAVRLEELKDYRDELEQESDRLERARISGTVFSRLRVTHCPACDRSIEATNETECYVCHRSTEYETAENPKQRFNLEQKQLEAEIKEASELAAKAESTLRELSERASAVRESARLVKARLVPMTSRTAAILPPEVTQLDMEYGILQEKLNQIDRTRDALAHRDELAKRIDELQHQISELESAVEQEKMAADFEQRGDVFADAMNTYLNSIRQLRPNSWTQADVSVDLRERDLSLLVGNKRWSKKLGGTLTLYFLLAYNYALLSLSNREHCNYPGLAILDLPPKLEDGSTTADKENFVLVPFARLMTHDRMRFTQAIVTGSSFESLDAHRIELTQVWT